MSQKNSESGGSVKRPDVEAPVLAADGVLGQADEVGAR